MADSKLVIILTAVVVITLVLGLLITFCYSQRLANKSSTSTFDIESLVSREPVSSYKPLPPLPIIDHPVTSRPRVPRHGRLLQNVRQNSPRKAQSLLERRQAASSRVRNRALERLQIERANALEEGDNIPNHPQSDPEIQADSSYSTMRNGIWEGLRRPPATGRDGPASAKASPVQETVHVALHAEPETPTPTPRTPRIPAHHVARLRAAHRRPSLKEHPIWESSEEALVMPRTQPDNVI